VSITGKTALVTGGGRGIGRSIAIRLATEGIAVAVNDLDLSRTEDVVNEIKSIGGKAIGIAANVVDENQVNSMVQKISEIYGDVDILINNAGGGQRILAEDMTVDEWRRIIELNLTSTFICCKAVMPGMIKKNYGRIVNIASLAAKKISFHAGIHYTAAKSGVLGLTRHLAFELAPYGITVNSVCPGGTLTPLLQSHTTAEELELRRSTIPIGRLMTPDDQANATIFFVLDDSSGVTGQAIDVDGGSILGWVDQKTYREARKKWTQTGRK